MSGRLKRMVIRYIRYSQSALIRPARFLLSLNQAIDTVFAALRQANRGKTYVPNVASATVTNIAKALIGSRKNKDKS